MYLSSSNRMASVTDGTSNSLAIGEALFRPQLTGPDLYNLTYQIVDHWYIGSDNQVPVSVNPLLYQEFSEEWGRRVFQ